MFISLLGDIALNGLFVEEEKFNIDRLLPISKILPKVDINFTNLETPIAIKQKENKLKKVILGTDKEVLINTLKDLNISCVSLANNHIYDYSDEGIEETIKCLDEIGVKWNGIRLKSHENICAIIEKNGFKIGFLAYVDFSTNPMIISKSKYYINVLDPETTIGDIKKAKKECDYLIISLHWGRDYSNYFTNNQRKIAHDFVNAGADVIMGHHPHVVQAYENYAKCHIFYSLGNLCHGDYYKEGKIKALRIKTKKSIIALWDIESNKVDFITTKEEKNNFIKVQPNIVWKNNYRITLLKNQYKFIHYLLVIKESIIDRFYDFLFGYYRKPIKEIMNIKNLKKIKYINEDINSLK